MKKDIHPEYKPTTVTCGCGEVFETRSTREKIKVEICSKCHPFYTGKQKYVDTAGRVEKFQKRYAWTEDTARERATTPGKKSAKAEKPGEAEQPKAE